ncbi:hypothetical protein SK128_007301 [Halocaridina rubra]|uniref:Uncharacterized protein n=1 Tax=Halocaridina rubra TaxID=373956 RepID=A0AAN8WRH4_HALRR
MDKRNVYQIKFLYKNMSPTLLNCVFSRKITIISKRKAVLKTASMGYIYHVTYIFCYFPSPPLPVHLTKTNYTACSLLTSPKPVGDRRINCSSSKKKKASDMSPLCLCNLTQKEKEEQR